MDILRHTGRAQLSSFIGGSPSNRAMDRAQWQFAPYTEADLQRQIDEAPASSTARPAGSWSPTSRATSPASTRTSMRRTPNPTLMPAEYAALGKLPQPWKATDVVAEASLIGGIFGKGGGRELDSAPAHAGLREALRPQGRPARMAGLPLEERPRGPDDRARARFPYETGSAFAKRGLALPDPGSVAARAGGAAGPGQAAASAQRPSSATSAPSSTQALHRPHASNWELVSRARVRTGHPIGVLGPQVGYYQPQILMEMDVHGPGHRRPRRDLPRRQPLRAARARPRLRLERHHGHLRQRRHVRRGPVPGRLPLPLQGPVPGDGGARPHQHVDARTGSTRRRAGSETLKAYRTVHGIVFARGKVGGKEVAFVTARSTYFHEADSALFFTHMNNPGFMKDGPSRSAGRRDDELRLQLVLHRLRAHRLLPDRLVPAAGPRDLARLPDPRDRASTTGRATTRPRTRRTGCRIDQHPHAVDPPYLVSWNNKQAPGWAAADDQYAYGPIHRSQLIADRVQAAIRGGRQDDPGPAGAGDGGAGDRGPARR